MRHPVAAFLTRCKLGGPSRGCAGTRGWSWCPYKQLKEAGAHPHGPSGAILALISSSDFYLFIFGVCSSGTSLLQTCSLGRVIYSPAFQSDSSTTNPSDRALQQFCIPSSLLSAVWLCRGALAQENHPSGRPLGNYKGVSVVQG